MSDANIYRLDYGGGPSTTATASISPDLRRTPSVGLPSTPATMLATDAAIKNGFPPDFYSLPQPPNLAHEDYPGIPMSMWSKDAWKLGSQATDKGKKDQKDSRISFLVTKCGTPLTKKERSDVSKSAYEIWDQIYEQKVHPDGSSTGLIPPQWFKSVPASISNYYVRKITHLHPCVAYCEGGHWKALEIGTQRYGTWIAKQPNVDKRCVERRAQKRAAEEISKEKRAAKKAKIEEV